jgi:hypothetical protein
MNKINLSEHMLLISSMAKCNKSDKSLLFQNNQTTVNNIVKNEGKILYYSLGKN